MLRTKPQPYAPPSTPNWTGRTHRTLDEAYGRRVPLAECRAHPCPRGVLVAVGLAVMVVLAGVML